MKSLAVLALLLMPCLALAQTEVSGSQSGVWDFAGSPYLVTGQITVPSGQTLTIEPGVEVNFQGHYKFTVNGNLQALGTEAAMILFTTDTPEVGWGGIRISSSVISALDYCRIEYGKTAGSYPDNHGGALALLGSDAVMTGCVFADNDATAGDSGMGGAVYASGTGSAAGPLTRFIGCSFIRNHAYGEGGAIKFTSDLNTEITGCEFIGNDCNYGGGAISFYGATGTTMTRCLFADNYTMYSNGGAMNTLGFGNTIYLINCTVTGNSAVTGDGGGVNLAYATAYFVNTIVYGNPGMYSDDVYLDWGGLAEMYYCDLAMPAGAIGHDNIDEDPLFVDPGNLDFNLSVGSPCIDAGTAYIDLGGGVVIDLDPEDYEGTAPDMGAFESGPETGLPAGSPTPCMLYRNFPNPFGPKTTISYQLTSDTHVTMKVYDVRGRAVKTLVSGEQTAGDRAIIWNGLDNSDRPVSPGIYFIRLQAGGELSSIRVLLSQ